MTGRDKAGLADHGLPRLPLQGRLPPFVPPHRPTMKIYSWNVNGLRAVLKKGLFMPFIETHQPDVLCLQETKSEREQVEIDLAGYHEYWNSATTKGLFGHGDLQSHRTAIGDQWLRKSRRQEIHVGR